MNRIAYRAGYAYQLARPYEIGLGPPFVGYDIATEFLRLGPEGRLWFAGCYAWNGPSGPAIDTRTIMRASLVHDAIYQMIRLGLLPATLRGPADRIYDRLCREDLETAHWALKPLLKMRASVHFASLRVFGWGSTDPEAERPVLRAP